MDGVLKCNRQVEAELLKSSLAGCTEAFGAIVERYQSLICSITYSATGDFGKSEELAQETFIRAWKELRQLKDWDRFRAWLCMIARNLVRKSIQSRQKDVMVGAEQLGDAGRVKSAEPGPAERIISKEQQEIVWRALHEIPENYREPMVLFYRQQQSVMQVAAGLGLSEEVTKQRLSRGRRMLKENVVALVEGTLGRTRPGKVFTVAVIAALPPVAVQTASAAIAGAAAKGSAAAKSAGLLSWIGAWGPVLGLLGIFFGIRASFKNTASPRERKFVTWTTLIQIGCTFAFIIIVVPLVLWWKLYLSRPLWPIFAIYIFLLAVTVIPFSVWSSRRQKQIQIEEGTYVKPEKRMLKMTKGEIYGAFAGSIFGSHLWLYRVLVAAKDWAVLWAVLAATVLIFWIATKLCLKARHQGFRIAIGVFITVGLLHLLVVNLRWERWTVVLGKVRDPSLGEMNLVIAVVVMVLVLLALVMDLRQRKMRRNQG